MSLFDLSKIDLSLDKNSIEYNHLRDKIINVGEYKNASETN